MGPPAERRRLGMDPTLAFSDGVCYERPEMYEVRQETTVASAHQLRDAPGEGERLHGHNWRIVAFVRCDALDGRAMVVDFNDLGEALRRIAAPYEHALLNEIAPYDRINPTAESIARVVADALAAKLDDARVRVHRVEVWETESCAAVYFR
jgi:6-pyruvoyltetrahydropterin/6-carboxytetrahydropterin synthase